MSEAERSADGVILEQGEWRLVLCDADGCGKASRGESEDGAPKCAEHWTCSECGGATVEFKGSGHDMQYRVCTRNQVPGHLSEAECDEKIQAVRGIVNPSGRQG